MKKIIIFFVLLILTSCGTTGKSHKEKSTREPASVNDNIETISSPEEYSIEQPPTVTAPPPPVAASPAPPRPVETVESSESSELIVSSPSVEFTEEEVVSSTEETPSTITKPILVEEETNGTGRLVYEIPDEMVKFNTYKIEVRIGENENDIRILENIDPIVDTQIRTSELMQVELVDPTDKSFTIVSQSAQQLVEVGEHTTWVFYVTPLKHGQNYISVVVSIIKDGNLKQSVYEDSVLVNTSTWIEIKNFFGKYWQWIIGFLVTVIIPFGIWLYKYFKKKKEKTSE